MRIAFLAQAANPHTIRWVRGLAGRGHVCRVFDSTETDPANPAGLDMVATASLPLGRLGCVPKVRRLVHARAFRAALRAFAPDLIHIHYLGATWETLHYLRGFHPILGSAWGTEIAYGGPLPEPSGAAAKKRRVIRRCDALSATSRFLRDALLSYAPEREAEVIPFGVDTALFRPAERKRGGGAAALFFPKWRFPVYGLDILLDAFARLLAEGMDLRLRFAGGDLPGGRASPGEIDIRSALTEDRFRGRIESLGRLTLEGMAAAYREADICVIPSRQESFGVVALEASASGVPVIASRVGGLPEVVEDGRTGLLVPPEDPAALATAIAQLAAHPETREAMGRAGREFVRARYEWKQSLDQMEALYGRIV